MKKNKMIIKGAGVAGLWTAFFALKAGLDVEIYDPQSEIRSAACSYVSGGMLAPYCEKETSDDAVFSSGKESLILWQKFFPELVTMTGTLIVAHTKDYNRLRAFADQTEGFERVNGERIAELEPALSARFETGLYYSNEGFLEPRRALIGLTEAVRKAGGVFYFEKTYEEKDVYEKDAVIVDCTGLAAKPYMKGLRGVRGEILTVRAGEVRLSRPVRLLHMRHPIYIIPRPDQRFTVGATSIENENASPYVTVRSAGELLTRLFDLHSGFAEAEILEMNAGLRPALFDHSPVVISTDAGKNLYFNGLYRHGWTIAPAISEKLIMQIIENLRF